MRNTKYSAYYALNAIESNLFAIPLLRTHEHLQSTEYFFLRLQYDTKVARIISQYRLCLVKF